MSFSAPNPTGNQIRIYQPDGRGEFSEQRQRVNRLVDAEAEL